MAGQPPQLTHSRNGHTMTNQPNETFRQALRRIRSARGLSQEQLGQLVNYSGGYISELELGRKPPNPDLAHRLDRALNTDGHLAQLAASGIAEPVDAPWTADAARTTLAGVTETALMDRRDFLALTGAGAISLAHAWNTAPDGPPPITDGSWVTNSVVDRLHARVEELWHLDDIIGGGNCLEPGISDLRLVQRLIHAGNYSTPVGQRLLSLGAALARFCGFAAFDSNLNCAAQRLWHAGLRLAAAAGDTDQGVYIVSNLALQAVYAGDGPTALNLLNVAKQRVDRSARTVLAMLDCWATRAHAIARDSGAVAATLNRADDLWERRRDGDDPAWVYWMPQPSLTAEAGTALMEAGDLRAAEQCLMAGMGTLDAGSVRERHLYLVRLAEVYLRCGRLDEAVSTARDAHDSAGGVDSARVRRHMTELVDRLPRQDRRVVELRDYMAAA